MLDNSFSYDAGGPNAIRVAANPCGCVYQLDVSSRRRHCAAGGAARALTSPPMHVPGTPQVDPTTWSATNMYGLACGTPSECAALRCVRALSSCPLLPLSPSRAPHAPQPLPTPTATSVRSTALQTQTISPISQTLISC